MNVRFQLNFYVKTSTIMQLKRRVLNSQAGENTLLKMSIFNKKCTALSFILCSGHYIRIFLLVKQFKLHADNVFYRL